MTSTLATSRSGLLSYVRVRRPYRARTGDLLAENEASFANSSNGPLPVRAHPRGRTGNLALFRGALFRAELGGQIAYVEPAGIEPATSGVPLRRSPELS